MQKIIRLTENDLQRIIKRVIHEKQQINELRIKRVEKDEYLIQIDRDFTSDNIQTSLWKIMRAHGIKTIKTIKKSGL